MHYQIGANRLSMIHQANAGLRIQDATVEQINGVLRYVFTLLGLNKLPNELETIVLHDFMRLHYADLYRLDEIKLAFSLGMSGAFEIETKTYGETFSVKFLSAVMKNYNHFRHEERKKKALQNFTESKKQEQHLPNALKLNLILNVLSDETKQKVSDIGKVDKSLSQAEKLPFFDIHQEWLRRFDKLRRNFEVTGTNGRFIKRYGKMIDIEAFFSKKAEQLQLAKSRNK